MKTLKITKESKALNSFRSVFGLLFITLFGNNIMSQQIDNNLIVQEKSNYSPIYSDSTSIIGDKPEINTIGDTTHIKLGKKSIKIVEKNGKTIVDIEDLDKKDSNVDKDKNRYSDNSEKFKQNKKNEFEPHWGGFELTLNNFLTSNFSLNLPSESQFLELNTSKSIGVRINLFEYSIPFSRFQGFTTGLGFEFNSYYFSSKNNNITKLNGKIVAKYKPEGASDYSKNKLKDTYLNIPLFYEIQFPLGNIKKPLYFSAGIIGGLKLGSRTKEYYNLDGYTKKEVVKSDFYLSPIRFGYQTRIGFRSIHLVATYFQTPLFLAGKGPEIYPFDIGLMIINW